jgi:hypothetical protein
LIRLRVELMNIHADLNEMVDLLALIVVHLPEEAAE